MILQKWNWSKHTYEDYEVPNNWVCKCYSDDMNEIVNCPHCGEQITFGESYTSMEIHTDLGFGYAVCLECYTEEWIRRDESQIRRIMGDEKDVCSKTKES